MHTNQKTLQYQTFPDIIVSGGYWTRYSEVRWLCFLRTVGPSTSARACLDSPPLAKENVSLVLQMYQAKPENGLCT